MRGDVAGARPAAGQLHRAAVEARDHGLAHVDVVEGLDRGVHRDVAVRAGRHEQDLVAVPRQRLLDHRRRRRAVALHHPGALQDPAAGDRRVAVALLDVDRVEVGGTDVACARPVRIADELDEPPRLAAGDEAGLEVVLDHVRAGEGDVLVVVGRRLAVELRRVLLRHRHGDRHGQRLRDQRRLGLGEPDDQRARVGRLDAGDRADRARLLRGADDRLEVGERVAAGDVGAEGALHRVLHVAGDDLAVDGRGVADAAV